MTDKLYAEYGNAGHRFPLTTGEAFGPGETIFVATECDDEDEELSARDELFIISALVVYTLAAIVIGVILWGPK